LQRPCTSTSEDAATCLSGFSIQGNFESARRNYTRIWAQMDDARSTGMLPTAPPVKPFHLHLVGRGDVKTLGIPPAVANMTTVHFNLKFPQYYDQVSSHGCVVVGCETVSCAVVCVLCMPRQLPLLCVAQQQVALAAMAVA
jgi:hypothetical protein